MPGTATKPEPELTFGQRAVGMKFNPSGNEDVDSLKTRYAELIDFHNDSRNAPNATPEQKRLHSIAITELQGAQMWSVKAATWSD